MPELAESVNDRSFNVPPDFLSFSFFFLLSLYVSPSISLSDRNYSNNLNFHVDFNFSAQFIITIITSIEVWPSCLHTPIVFFSCSFIQRFFSSLNSSVFHCNTVFLHKGMQFQLTYLFELVSSPACVLSFLLS